MAECQIVTMLFTWAISDDQRWPRIRFRFLNRFHRLVELRAERNLRHINQKEVEHAAAAELISHYDNAIKTLSISAPDQAIVITAE